MNDFRLAMKSVKNSLATSQHPNQDDIETLYNALTEARRIATMFFGWWLDTQNNNPGIISFQTRLNEVDEKIQENLDEIESEMSR